MRAFSLSIEQLATCPVGRLDVPHWREDGTCLCFPPREGNLPGWWLLAYLAVANERARRGVCSWHNSMTNLLYGERTTRLFPVRH